MIPTITNNHSNNISIPSKSFRRHSDPAWMWIVASIGSVSLHLLVFWLMRSSEGFKPWFPQSNQSSIPIEYIEIAAEPKSTIKQQSQTPNIKPEFSFSQSSKSAVITPSNQDDEIISQFNLPQQNKIQKPEVRKPKVEKPKVETPEVIKPKVETLKVEKPEVRKPEVETPKVEKPEVRKPEVEQPEVRKPEVETPEVRKPEVETPETEKPPVRQQSYPTNPTPETTPIIPENELPWNQRQEIKLGKGTLLPQDIPADSPTPTPEPTPNVNRGGAIATITPMLKQEVSKLIQQKQLIVDALPDVFAEYKGSTDKELEASILPSEEGLKPATILASLIIDSNGQFQEAIVIAIEPATLRNETNTYEQALNQIFEQEKFIAAYNQDGSKPDLSNLYIRLQIRPINSQ